MTALRVVLCVAACVLAYRQAVELFIAWYSGAWPELSARQRLGAAARSLFFLSVGVAALLL